MKFFLRNFSEFLELSLKKPSDFYIPRLPRNSDLIFDHKFAKIRNEYEIRIKI